MDINKYFKQIDHDELERWVHLKQEENVYLEFKTVNHPDYNDRNRHFDKENFSKCLSGFANSSGGIIVWGVKADKDVNGVDCANQLKPIKSLKKLVNMFNSLDGLAVTPTIKGIVHKEINIGNDIGFIKSLVPESDVAPHMANFAGKHYYKRNGDSFYQAEHFDIVDMFSRRKEPRLQLRVKNFTKQLVHQTRWRLELVLSIENVGQSVAKFPYLAINSKPQLFWADFGLDGNGFTGLKRTRNNIDFNFTYTGGNEIVIHPKMILDVDKLRLEIQKDAQPPDFQLDCVLMAENMETQKKKIVIKGDSFV